MTKKTDTYTAFPSVVCERIRRLVQLGKNAESQRKKAFDARDHVRDEIARITKEMAFGRAKQADIEHKQAEFGATIMEIERLQKTLKWVSGEINIAVERADEPGLFDDADVQVPNFDSDDEAEDKEQGTLAGAGEEGQPAPSPKKTKAKPEPIRVPEPPVGVDQHMTATVNELDLSEAYRERLADAGFSTIGSLDAFVRDGGNIRDRLDCGENIASAVLRALKAYKQRQLKAELEREREAAGEATGAAGSVTTDKPVRVGRGAGRKGGDAKPARRGRKGHEGEAS